MLTRVCVCRGVRLASPPPPPLCPRCCQWLTCAAHPFPFDPSPPLPSPLRYFSRPLSTGAAVGATLVFASIVVKAVSEVRSKGVGLKLSGEGGPAGGHGTSPTTKEKG